MHTYLFADSFLVHISFAITGLTWYVTGELVAWTLRTRCIAIVALIDNIVRPITRETSFLQRVESITDPIRR